MASWMRKEALALMTSTKTNSDKTLVVITGPTGVGKTSLSIEIAGQLQTEIVSADARQFYKELKVGTAAPTTQELAQVKHHFVGHLSVNDYYNVSLFEQEALTVIDNLFLTHDYVVLTGGSGLYIDAICRGFDDIPSVDVDSRNRVEQVHQHEGMDALRLWLKSIDPAFYLQVDLANPNRIKRAIEVFLSTGKRFSELRTNSIRPRPFNIKVIVVDRPRKELFESINKRVDQMVANGLIEEALQFFRKQHLNALNTVGYKEIFDWLAGTYTLKEAIEKIKTNSRRYAKRQITWFKRYPEAQWMHPDDLEGILSIIME
jgi:tRNA dimethylallyltransferase